MEKEICVLKNFRNILDATTDTDCTDLDNAIKTIEYAMKSKTCDGCIDEEISSNRCEQCVRLARDFYNPMAHA